MPWHSTSNPDGSVRIKQPFSKADIDSYNNKLHQMQILKHLVLQLNFKIGVLLRKWLVLWNFSIFHLPVQASGNWMKMIHSLQDRILFSVIFSPFSSSVHFVANSTKSHKWRVTFVCLSQNCFYVNVLPSVTTIKASHLVVQQLSPPRLCAPQTLTKSPSSTRQREPFTINHDRLVMSWSRVSTVIWWKR